MPLSPWHAEHVAGSPSGTAMSQACSHMTESIPAMIEELGSGLHQAKHS